MATYNNSIVVKFDTKDNGNSGAGKLVTVFNEGTVIKADLFDLNQQPLANPVTADESGNYTFDIADGVYDLHIDYGLPTKTSILSEPISDPAILSLINDITQTYDFDTLALMKSSTISFPDNKRIHVIDIGTDYVKITGTGTANESTIYASDTLDASFELVFTDIESVPFSFNNDDPFLDNDVWNVIQSTASVGQAVNLSSGTVQGNFTTNKTPISGQGSSSIIKTFGTAAFSLTLDRHLPDWDFQNIKDVKFDGQSKVGSGVSYGSGFASGRWDFDHVLFENLDIAVSKEHGQIGNMHNRSTFKGNNIGYKSLGTPIAPFVHAGNDLFHGCHWEGSEIAAYFLFDTVPGGGQVSFNENIFEASQGSAIVVREFGLGMPYVPLHLNKTWFELNAQAGGTKSIDGYVFNNKDVNIRDAGIVMATGTYLKDIELQGTTVVCNSCRIDNNVHGSYDNVIDSNSAFVVHDFYGDNTSATSLFIQNYAHVAKWQGTNVAAQLMAHRSIRTIQGHGFNAGEPFDSGANYAWTGSVARASTPVVDGLISDSATELLVNAGDILISPSPARGAILTGKWNVVTLGFKQISGTSGDIEVNIWDGAADRITFPTTGNGRRLNQWYTGVALIDSVNKATTPNLKVYLRGFNTNGSIRFADFQMMAFDTKQDALNYIDSREYQA